MSALLEAIEARDGEAVTQILIATHVQQQGTGAAADVLATADACGETAMHIAASVGDEDIVQQLLLAGAAVDVQDQRWDRPLHVAGESRAAKLRPPGAAKAARRMCAGTCAILHPLQYDILSNAPCHMVSCMGSGPLKSAQLSALPTLCPPLLMHGRLSF
jgi:hypothetical protein